MSAARILVIDDEQELLDLLSMSLSMEGYEIITAQDGEEGVAKFDEFHPQLVICDIIMPKLDGYEVLRKIRDKQKKWTPFIMLSAVGDCEKIKRAYDGDTDFYLTKPVHPSVIIRNIKTLLNLARDSEA